MSIKIKRIYEAPESNDGYRILVDRLWPRGISKDNAQLDEWNKDLAPSDELRKWFNHQPELFAEFTKKYKSELKSQEDILKRLKLLGKKQNLTLLYAAKDTEHNNAVVLLHLLTSS